MKHEYFQALDTLSNYAKVTCKALLETSVMWFGEREGCVFIFLRENIPTEADFQ